jgi:hypothetical protein
MAMKMPEITVNERVYQLALEEYQLAETRLAGSGSHADWLRFEAAKADLDEALRMVKAERGMALAHV